MKRRILLVDDDLAVLLTLKAVLELHGFEVDTAGSSTEAFARLQSGIYQLVISDLRMETEDSGLEVLRVARRQSYNPATALLTAYPPAGNPRGENRGEHGGEEDWSAANSDSLLIKPLGTSALLRQVEALLVSHADKSQSNGRNQAQSGHSTKAQDRKRHAG
jgi:CheY-like chemotaxis protein